MDGLIILLKLKSSIFLYAKLNNKNQYIHLQKVKTLAQTILNLC